MIKQMRQQGAYIVDIATQVGCSERTVRRYLKYPEPPARKTRHKMVKLKPFMDYIDMRLAENVWNSEVILAEIKAMGYTGGRSMLRYYIQPKRKMRPSKRTVRFQALGGVKAALSGIQAVQALELNNAQQAAQQAGSGEAAPAAFGMTASLGSQSSKSEQKTQSHTVSGSTLNSGHDIHIAATGDGHGHGGDITVQGSQAKAAHDIYLDAQRDIQLLSALNTQTLSGKNSSHGGSVGVGINVGQNTGITVSASVNAAKGHENGTTLTHTNTTLDAGNHVTLNAGRDATLNGAQVNGEKITADVKRNLTLQSEQDSDHYDSKQQSTSAGASFTYGSMSGSASVSLSQDKIHSNFDSVKDQTGLFAGKEGFDVTTGQHTQLDGAVIASTADKSKNRLDTGTLGFSDIHNQADFTAQHQGISVGTGGSVGSQLLTNMATNTLSGVNKSGHESSTTHAAVSDGSLIVRNTADQKQDTSTLSRDTEHAANGLSPVFDKEKVQRQLQQAQMVSDISSQVLDIYNTYETINATRKATEDMQNASTRQDARKLAEKELSAEKDKHPSVTVDEETITKRAYQNLYNKELEHNQGRLGDPMRQAVTASVAVLSGLAGGDIKAALANGAAPYLATGLKLITGKDTPSDEQMAVRLLGHAIIGGVVAELNGAPAAGGAVGAVSGEVAAITISKLYFGKPPSELNESEREQLSGMSTIAAALAGSLASDSATGTIAGAQAGKNAVENNALSDLTEAASQGKTPQQVAKERVEAENERYKKENCAGMSAEACSVKMYTQRQAELKDILLTGADFTPVVGTIKSVAEAQSALDYLLAAASVIPGERIASGILKNVEKALAKGDLSQASKLLNKASDEIQIKWVDENAGMSQRARNYNDSATGARSNVDTQKGQAPTIDRIDANGNSKPVRFDGVDGNVMIDRKISVVTTQKAKDQALRQSEALKNNGMTGRWEVPNQAQANRAQKMFDELGIKNIEVKIVKE